MIAEQLAMGVRFLPRRTHNSNSTIQMCHTSCFLRDAGSLEDMLLPIKAFLDVNPAEVSTLLFTNQDVFEGGDFDIVFIGVGLDQYAFAPERKLELIQWPTLGGMIDKGNRLDVFMGMQARRIIRHKWVLPS